MFVVPLDQSVSVVGVPQAAPMAAGDSPSTLAVSASIDACIVLMLNDSPTQTGVSKELPQHASPNVAFAAPHVPGVALAATTTTSEQ